MSSAKTPSRTASTGCRRAVLVILHHLVRREDVRADLLAPLGLDEVALDLGELGDALLPLRDERAGALSSCTASSSLPPLRALLLAAHRRPDGTCTMRTALSTLLTFWPPAPPDRIVLTSRSAAGISTSASASSRSSVISSTPAKLVCRLFAALNGESRTRRWCAALGAQQPVRVLVVDCQPRRLDPRLLAVGPLGQRRARARLPLGPPRVHPQQHLRPVLRVDAARAGEDGEHGAARVVLAVEQRARRSHAPSSPPSASSAASASGSSDSSASASASASAGAIAARASSSATAQPAACSSDARRSLSTRSVSSAWSASSQKPGADERASGLHRLAHP